MLKNFFASVLGRMNAGIVIGLAGFLLALAAFSLQFSDSRDSREQGEVELQVARQEQEVIRQVAEVAEVQRGDIVEAIKAQKPEIPEFKARIASGFDTDQLLEFIEANERKIFRIDSFFDPEFAENQTHVGNPAQSEIQYLESPCYGAASTCLEYTLYFPEGCSGRAKKECFASFGSYFAFDGFFTVADMSPAHGRMHINLIPVAADQVRLR